MSQEPDDPSALDRERRRLRDRLANRQERVRLLRESGRTRASLVARLLDLRVMIGLLFLVFGVIVTLTGLLVGNSGRQLGQGLTADPDDLARVQDLELSLWTGLGMLVTSGAFLLWASRAPLELPTSVGEEDMEPPELGEPLEP